MRHGMWWALGWVLCASPACALAQSSAWASPDDQTPPTLSYTQQSLLPSDTRALTPLGNTLETDQPIMADQAVSDESIYAVPPPSKEDEGVNNGGVHVELNIGYLNRYVYRGVDHDNVSRRGNAFNLGVDAKLSYDLGAYPHPFIGVFTNVYDSDPVSRFQEIRPYVGATWNLRPFLLEAGDIDYIYPEREDFNTAEAYVKFGIDDSWLFRTQAPIFNPYIFAAYDYTRNHGEYFEAGFSHDFVFSEIGLVITPKVDVAYIVHYKQQFVFINTVRDTGWQHLDVGLTASYSLNSLLNVSRRYGEFDLKGFFFYTDKLTANITADYVLWGGGGIGFKY